MIRRHRKLIFYFVVVSCFGLFIWLILQQGLTLQAAKFQNETAPATPSVSFDHHSGASVWQVYFKEILGNIKGPLSILLLQVMVIIVIARCFGFFFKRIHQPNVIGEILAGIVLGPSLLGHFYPQVFNFLFPLPSLGNLKFLSQIGLILFMFIIGMELDLKYLKNKAHEAIVISHAGIIFPFTLGVGLAWFIYAKFAPPQVEFLPFALFMGIAMSITAFPVLARIVQERGLTKTALGAMALTCAAADDVTAWCILAAVIALVKAGNLMNALFTLTFAAVYIGVMIKVVQPIMQKAGGIYTSKENLSKTIMALVFMVLLASAYAAESIGIHALFGAFIAGVVMPQNLQFKKILTDKLEDISIVLLMPLFFVFTGLHTQIGLLNDANMWLVCAAVIGVAVAGKFGGTLVAARVVGQSWKNSLSMGALMNTRGLMQLIVLEIGYDLGILTPVMFSIMIIMALVTTFMTGPALSLINLIFKGGNELIPKQYREHAYRILMSFGPPKMGSSLIKLSNLLSVDSDKGTQYTAMHITPTSEINPQEAIMYEKEAFQPLKTTAQILDITVDTRYKATEEIGREIVNTANNGNYDLLLVGAARSVFNENILGGKIRAIIEEAGCDVAVFSERGLEAPEKVLIIIFSDKDAFLLDYAERMQQNKPDIQLVVLDINDLQAKHPDLFIAHENSNQLIISKHKLIDKDFLEPFNLVLVSITYWHQVMEARSQWVQYAPSVLLFKKFKRGF